VTSGERKAIGLGKDLELGPIWQQAENCPGLVPIRHVHGQGDLITGQGHKGREEAERWTEGRLCRDRMQRLGQDSLMEGLFPAKLELSA